jgi:hypothetical protein
VLNYPEQLEALRRRLAQAGERKVAEELLQAERGGSTSSEILAETGTILRRLLESGEAQHLQLADEIRRLYVLGRELFESTNRKF